MRDVRYRPLRWRDEELERSVSNVGNILRRKHEPDSCNCCYGTGVQYNHRTGLRQECPCCGGSGKKRGWNILKKPKIWV
jgi:DnaJ-class molecular chaperone